MMKLSIITVVYNDPFGLEKTINSVIKQKNKNYEFLIIDGESSYTTQNIIKKYRRFIDQLISEKDKGTYFAMNKGIDLSCNEIITFLNAGDTVDNDYVENILNNIGCHDYIYSGVKLIFKSGKIKKYLPKKITKKTEYLQRMPFPHPGLAVKKKCFELIGKFNTNKKITADHYWVVSLIKSNLTGIRGNYSSVNFEVGGQSNNYQAIIEMFQTALFFGRMPILACYFLIRNFIVTTYYKIQNN